MSYALCCKNRFVTMNKNINYGLICHCPEWYEWSAMFVSVILIGWQGIHSGHQWSPPTAVVRGGQDVPLCGGSHQPETGRYSGGGTPRWPELPLLPPAIPSLREPPPVPAQRSASLAPRTRITRGCWRSVNSQTTKIGKAFSGKIRTMQRFFSAHWYWYRYPFNWGKWRQNQTNWDFLSVYM